MKKFEKITHYDYVALVPALREYRKKMMGAMGMQPGLGYNRLFTEQREFGARSKYWLTNGGFMVASIAGYVSTHPTIVVGNDTYSVDFRRVDSNGYGQSYALYVNKIATANTALERICDALKTAYQATYTNTKNTENMQNSEATNNAVNTMIKKDDVKLNTPYMLYSVEIPVEAIPGTIFTYRGSVENPYNDAEGVNLIDWDWKSDNASHALVEQTLTVILGATKYNAMLKELEELSCAKVAASLIHTEAVEPAQDAMGEIDWIAVMRAFEENFNFHQELANAAENVDVDDAVSFEVNSSYGGREFTIDAEIDASGIARSMEDSLADAIYEFCKDQAAL